MFGLLGSSQIYGLQHEYNHNDANIKHKDLTKNISHTNSTPVASHKQRHSTANHTESGSKFFASLSSMQGIKSPTNFIEKFIKNELLNSYDTIKNYKNFQNSTNSSVGKGTFFTSSNNTNIKNSSSAAGGGEGDCDVGLEGNSTEGLLASFNCLQGSYRSTNNDQEFYEPVNVSLQRNKQIGVNVVARTTKPSITLTAPRDTEADMTIKYSKNLLANTPDEESPATLQNYQKLSECEQDLLLSPSSGASSGEFNSDANAGSSSQTTTPVNSLYKRLSFGGRGTKSGTDNAAAATTQSTTAAVTNEVVSDFSSSTNSSSSPSSTLSSKNTSLALKSIDLKRTSSASSSGDCEQMRDRRKYSPVANSSKPDVDSVPQQLTPERAQRRKLISMISHYEQQTKLLQRELAKEKRRRSEELACVVKSLLCFESKLRKDMKAVNQRLLEKDTEICRLVQQNRALRKRLTKITEVEGENARDEGVVEDGDPEETEEVADEERSEGKEVAEVGQGSAPPTSTYSVKELLEDCLVLEALQCINCKKQFYDIDLNESWTKNVTKDGTRKNADHTTEHGSSSDDTVSSSFYGARRSVRYTSKRTSGTFRDYMRSRAMNIDDPALDNNSEENTSTVSRDDSQTSYEKFNIYSRTIERMHGVKRESERESEQSGVESTARTASRLSCKSNNSSKKSQSCAKSAAPQIEEDDGIFSPTQDDDFEEAEENGERSIKIVMRRCTDFSEASPKQVYETSTDDWYASASDQEESAPTAVANKSYAQGAVNPVLECVNQILLQQVMEEPVTERTNEHQPAATTQSPQNLTLGYSNVPNAVGGANLPRRSSLSGRRSSRSNSRSSDGQSSHNGTLTRKRVHFSTKNSMVHVPRNDEDDEGDEDDVDDNTHDTTADSSDTVISSLAQYHTMSYYPQAAQQALTAKIAVGATSGAISRGGMFAEVAECERLETLNYESIYSNEYEPIGSEHNSSNLYVDMDSTNKTTAAYVKSTTTSVEGKVPKLPPALPPKPANLLKFKKSLQQLDELPDEHLHQDGQTTIEPDYCSISEVNVGITSVQTVADIHKAPDSEGDLEANSVLESPISELDVEVSTMASDETCAVSQKTDEIEEIFADVPKLPNVAAIIAPKQAKCSPKQQTQTIKFSLPTSDYLVMSPNVETPIMKLQNARNATILNTASATKQKAANNLSSSHSEATTPKLVIKPNADYLNTPLRSPTRADPSALKLHLHTPSPLQYKRKHMPNILAEINKRRSLPNSPTTPTTRVTCSMLTKPVTVTKAKLEVNTLPNMPLQAEFDWYNLDAEYGRTTLQQPDLLKVNDTLSSGTMLAGIHEDGESIATTADEYNLDEEFSLANDRPDVLTGGVDGSEHNNESAEENSESSVVAATKPSATPVTLKPKHTQKTETTKLQEEAALNAAICEAVNLPMFSESSPLVVSSPVIAQHHAKAKKIKKNLANFEKFIEGSGLSTKPLPSKRKIYFAGPFV
ncbi:serine-rich adhesin for platelets-like [Eurosta solidaginis]|uniref:serine-rich adhesin for platelets-like n=1 Tax=Eurosta solidaginis TaxID=178769 RepID=UPI0035317643